MTSLPSPIRRVLLPLAAVVLAGAMAGLVAVASNPPSPPVEHVQALASGGPFTLDDLRGTPAPTPAPAPLPIPVRPPDDPYAPEPAVVLGTIEIPRLSLAVPLNQGISLHSIDRGPSHWPGTALPGDPGNVVIAGHRATHSAPFRDIDQLRAGDAVIFTVDGERSTYRVTGHEVVTPDAMRIVEQSSEPTATLFACHPLGSAEYRYVVSLDLHEVVDLNPTPTPRLIQP